MAKKSVQRKVAAPVDGWDTPTPHIAVTETEDWHRVDPRNGRGGLSQTESGDLFGTDVDNPPVDYGAGNYGVNAANTRPDGSEHDTSNT